ncbi:MAG: MotA/TolQ/ExbB proton channel family protein [Rivularia sp. T60_A2020_040]|nr:MotA/TolQ/ExbB proton channel family protein [Rivularia sp. T60_A2020_040]
MNIQEIVRKIGPVVWPLLFFSVLSLSVIFERIWFWLRILTQERKIVDRVLDAAQDDWSVATEIAERATHQPIGRFLYAPLVLPRRDPETFRLALESTAEHELALMRRGEKVLELVIAVAPLLGLFGTVWGLIQSLESIKISDLGTEASAGVPTGIGEALYSTLAGLVVAIFSLIFYRWFQALLVNQVKVFRKAGNELELLYRQFPPTDSDIKPARKALSEVVLRDKDTPENSPTPRRRGRNKFSEPPETTDSDSPPSSDQESQ